MKDLLLVSGGDPVNIFEVIGKGISSFTNLAFDTMDHHAIRKGFRYKNAGQRTINFFLKNFFDRNIKHEFYHSEVKRIIDSLSTSYKKILIIRPDLVSDYELQTLRERTDCFIAYYWDALEYAPRKKDITRFFDRILSFDPEDCKKYGFQFQCNFYWYETQTSEIRYEVYNLSSLDDRKKITEEIAMELENLGISYLFKGFQRKLFKNSYIQHTPQVCYKEMLREASYCNVVLDITKQGQRGLTFRPFEALGLNKKLITTNGAIKDYDFYNPENILIVQPGKVRLDKDFFERPYKNIPDSVKEKYHIKQWLNDVLS